MESILYPFKKPVRKPTKLWAYHKASILPLLTKLVRSGVEQKKSLELTEKAMQRVADMASVIDIR